MTKRGHKTRKYHSWGLSPVLRREKMLPCRSGWTSKTVTVRLKLAFFDTVWIAPKTQRF